MLVKTLIEVARMRSSKTLGQMAEELGVAHPRISEWKKGKYYPDATAIAYLATEAQLDVLETIRAIEEEKKPTLARIWSRVGCGTGGNGGFRQLLPKKPRKSRDSARLLPFRTRKVITKKTNAGM